jgi:hypothetical protein
MQDRNEAVLKAVAVEKPEKTLTITEELRCQPQDFRLA